MIDLVNNPSSFIKSLNYFNEQLFIDWGLCSRNQLPLSLFVIEVDELTSFTKNYGKSESDKCIQTIANALNSALRRESDFIAQADDQRLMFLSQDMSFKQAGQFANKCHRLIAKQAIPHAGSPIAEYVTISIGHATCTPDSINCGGPEIFLKTTLRHLNRAIKAGRNCSYTSLKFKSQ